jgi:hypothetical protein
VAGLTRSWACRKMAGVPGPGWSSFARWRLVSVAGILALLLASDAARAQGGLRVTQEPERVDGNQFVVAGRVLNETRRDALDVYVTVEALDAAKKVVASGIAYVGSSIPPRGEAPFVAKVPRMPGATTFRAAVTSYRYGLGSESP